MTSGLTIARVRYSPARARRDGHLVFVSCWLRSAPIVDSIAFRSALSTVLLSEIEVRGA
jgi:hypothetical protein